MARKDIIKEYISLLNDKRYDEALKYKMTFLPNKLYKYRPMNPDTLDCLTKGSAWLSPANRQNDPFECSLRQIDDDSIKDIVISSFSEICDSILMWAHYSDNHKGICIEYSFHGFDRVTNVLEPVYYSNKMMPYKNNPDFEISTRIARIAAITKAEDWSYEKEWRIAFPSEKSGHYKTPNPNSIHLGLKFKDNDEKIRKRLLNICDKKGIRVFETIPHKSNFKIALK